MIRKLLCLLLSLACTEVVFAQDWNKETIFSGPQAGEKLPPLPVEIAFTKPVHADFVKQAGQRVTLLVFVSGANRPAARLTRVLMNYAEMQSREKLFAATVWLTGDRTAARQYLKEASSWWGTGLPVGISLDGAEGPGAYGLNRQVNVTVLIAKDRVVLANFALVQPSETDAIPILKEVVKLIGGAVPSTPEIIFLTLPTRKTESAPWSTAPAEIAFRKRICQLLAARNPQEASRAHQEIMEYVDGNRDRQEQLKRVAEFLTKGRTSIGDVPATKFLNQWKNSSTTDQGLNRQGTSR